MEISLCMIVKNEEDVLGRCINSVKTIVDEIIVVDTGSTDNTISIAEKLGAKIYNFQWINDFSSARNYAFSKATKEYILWLDADDIFNPKDIDRFKELKSTLNPNIDSVTMNYVLTLGNNGEFINSIRRNRLVKKEKNFQWKGKVHEYLEVYGDIFYSDLNILHQKDKTYTDRNLKIYESIVNTGEELSPRDKYYYANELSDNGRFDEAIIQYKKFLDTNAGWIEDIKRACIKLADCYSYKKDLDNELKSILNALKYDTPNADLCCRLGYIFLSKNNLDTAIFWFRLATQSIPSKESMGVVNRNNYTYIPWIELCVCYSRKGDYRTAYVCNEMANKFKPGDTGILYNREFLKDKVDINELIIGNPLNKSF
jgi:glycosyltransferase involved in cell wall biosynthesis